MNFNYVRSAYNSISGFINSHNVIDILKNNSSVVIYDTIVQDTDLKFQFKWQDNKILVLKLFSNSFEINSYKISSPILLNVSYASFKKHILETAKLALLELFGYEYDSWKEEIVGKMELWERYLNKGNFKNFQIMYKHFQLNGKTNSKNEMTITMLEHDKVALTLVYKESYPVTDVLSFLSKYFDL